MAFGQLPSDSEVDYLEGWRASVVSGFARVASCSLEEWLVRAVPVLGIDASRASAGAADVFGASEF